MLVRLKRLVEACDNFWKYLEASDTLENSCKIKPVKVSRNLCNGFTCI